jgi:hypothetical protein
LNYVEVELEPGEGTILEYTLNNPMGICLFHEDFTTRPFGVKLNNINMEYYSRGWGIPCFWTAFPKTVPASIKIDNLVMKKPGKVTVSAGFPKKDSNVYLQLEGKLNGISVEVLDKSGKVIKTKRNKFSLPFLLPSKAYEILIRFGEKDAFVRDIKIWTSPK